MKEIIFLLLEVIGYVITACFLLFCSQFVPPMWNFKTQKSFRDIDREHMERLLNCRGIFPTTNINAYTHAQH